MGRVRYICRGGSMAALALALGAAAWGGPAKAAAAERETTVDTLVITAERRTEDLQTAAISATVLDERALEAKGVVGLTSLQYAAPGVQISDFSSANTFNIRGIGQSAVPVDLPSGVVIYRDGVPTLTGYFQNAPYYDLASVEVLRGPQGTFVGKSASAGAVFIRTRDPELGRLGGDITLGVGNRSYFEDTLVLNAPLGDTFALRVAVHGELRHSLFDSLTSNPLPGGINAGGPLQGDDKRRLISGRFGLLWAPNEHFRAVLKTDVDYLHFGSHATSGFDPVTGIEEDVSNPVVNGHHIYVDKGVRSSLNMSYAFDGGIKLNSLTGFSTVKTRADWDANGRNPAPSDFQSGGTFSNYSQELNLISPDDQRVRWVVGFFYQRYLNHIPKWPRAGLDFFTTNAPTPTFSTPWRRNEKNYAGFGQVAVDLTDRLELQVGGRYGHYAFDQFTQWELFPGTLNLPFFDPPGGIVQSYSENAFDWKVNLNWKVTDDHFLYALVSRGHTPGSINAGFNGVTPEHTAYRPMTVTNFEAGWKGSFFDDHLRTQLAAYYETFRNYQAAFALAVPQTGPVDQVSEFKNALTTSHTMGVELSAQGRFGDLSFDAGLALFRSKLGSFGAVVNPFQGFYGGPASIVLSGAKTPFAPEVTANAGVAYTFHLSDVADGATLTPRVDVAYRGDSYSYLFQNRSTLLPATTLVNASIRFEKGPWWASLWVTNLADRRYPGAKQNVGVGPADAFFPAPHIIGIVYMAPPRLFGLRVGYSF